MLAEPLRCFLERQAASTHASFRVDVGEIHDCDGPHSSYSRYRRAVLTSAGAEKLPDETVVRRGTTGNASAARRSQAAMNAGFLVGRSQRSISDRWCQYATSSPAARASLARASCNNPSV